MLTVEELSRRFGDTVALDGCSFSVARGQMLGLLGPNGAGKTTAMRIVFGLVRPDSGTVAWDGAPVGSTVRRGFGYMPEERGLYPKLSVRWQLAYFGRIHGMERSEAERAAGAWLEEVGLADRAESRIAELSHGNQQRVQLGAALIHNPTLVVLDEPFSGLDPIGAAGLAEVLKRRVEAGTAVVFSSHQLDLVEDLCRDVVILHRGKVVLEGAVNELRAASADRYVEVVGPDSDWISELEIGEVVEKANGRVRIRLRDGTDLAELAKVVSAAGMPTQFVFEPPPLSEIFKEAVAS